MISLIFFLSLTKVYALDNDKPNIIWIVCEDISPFLAFYNYNFVHTPNINQLAKEGVVYNHFFSTSGVCAPSRSAIITGMYQTFIGTQHMRTLGDAKYQPVPPYSAVIPAKVKCFPEYLRKAGYYCTNNEKQDYQFIAPLTVWAENGATASYRNRQQHKPFFSVYNFFITHESQLFSKHADSLLAIENVPIPPYYPNTQTMGEDISRVHQNIKTLDKQVGELLNDLKKDGLYENTIIMFFSDHGGPLPWMKREILNRGIHIPFIIRFPNGVLAGQRNDNLLSTIDLAPTILSLAGIKPPKYMQGQAFLGHYKVKKPRKYVYAARDRMDTEYDRVRSVRDKNYQFIYNYHPNLPFYQSIDFRMDIPMMKQLIEMKANNLLNPKQAAWFNAKPKEELYDLNSDPYQLKNLAQDLSYKRKLLELRKALKIWGMKYDDKGSIPEMDMIKTMWNGNKEALDTATPSINKVKNGVKLSCKTQGASIAYRIITKTEAPDKKMAKVRSWDFNTVFHTLKNGDSIVVNSAWNVYDKGIINLKSGQEIEIQALRIGYKPVYAKYVMQ